MKNKDVKVFVRLFSEEFGVGFSQFFNPNSKIEVIEFSKTNLNLFLIDGKPLLFRFDNKLLPTLIFERLLSHLPHVVVDMGAVSHICNGADVMIPGIIGIKGEFVIGTVVAVVDEKYGKSIAVGEAMVGSLDLCRMVHGKAVKNHHFVGDELWKTIQSLVKR